MRRNAFSAALVATSSLVVACGSDSANPFDDPSLVDTLPPPPGSSLVFTSDGWASSRGRGRELMAVAQDGQGLTRLTSCDVAGRACDNVEAALAPDRTRVVMRRVGSDTNGDGVLDERDAASLVFSDLGAQVEAELLAATQQATGIDWAPNQDLLLYSAQGAGGEDLFRTTPRRPTPSNDQQTLDLSCPVFAGTTPNCDEQLRERRPRIDPGGTVAAFERITPGATAEIWIFQTTASQTRVTSASVGGALLAGTPYRVGSDADPAFSPDSRSVVFRHLVAADAGGRGLWEIRTARTDGSAPNTLTSGELWRGAPDWGAAGIVFPEADVAGTRLVLVQPDGSGRRVVISFAPGVRLDHPRFIRPR